MRKTTLRAAGGLTTAAMALALAAALAPSAVAATLPRKFVPPSVQKVRVLPRTAVAVPAAGQRTRDRVSAAAAAELKSDGVRADSAWPAAGTGTATLPVVTRTMSTAAQRRAFQRPAVAGNLPVMVARAGTGADGGSQVHVRMLSHQAALDARVPGVIMQMSAPGTASGPVRVSLGYGAFRNAGSAG
ncbi:MAG: hypothetical protein ACRDN0_05485, partial [Trebonia sp.]